MRLIKFLKCLINNINVNLMQFRICIVMFYSFTSGIIKKELQKALNNFDFYKEMYNLM